MAHPLSSQGLERRLYDIALEAGIKGLQKPKNDLAESGIRLGKNVRRVIKHKKGAGVIREYMTGITGSRSVADAFVRRYKDSETLDSTIWWIEMAATNSEDVSTTRRVAAAFGQKDAAKLLNSHTGVAQTHISWPIFSIPYSTTSKSALQDVISVMSSMKNLRDLHEFTSTVDDIAFWTQDPHIIKRVAKVATLYEGLPLKYAMNCIWHAGRAYDKSKKKDLNHVRNVVDALDDRWGVAEFANLYTRHARREFMRAVWQIALYTGNKHAAFTGAAGAAGHRGFPRLSYLKNIGIIAEETKSAEVIHAVKHMPKIYQQQNSQYLPLIMNTLGEIADRTHSTQAVLRATKALTQDAVLSVLDEYPRGQLGNALNKIARGAHRGPNYVKKVADKYLCRIDTA